MASIDRRPNGAFRARWREHPNGPQHSRTFARKVDATQFLVEVSHQIQTGAYVDPRSGATPFATYVEEWGRRRRLRSSTAERHERELRLYLLPRFGRVPLVAITRPAIEQWAAELDLAPSSVAVVVQTLSSILSAAVEDGRLAINPVRGARLPEDVRPPLVPLEVAEVHRFAQAYPEHLRAAAQLAAGTGLRQGETFGLSVDRVDFLRATLRVDRQLWTPSTGRPVLVAPKARRSFRTVALSASNVEQLAEHLAHFGPGDDGLVFHQRNGRPVERDVAGAITKKAAATAGLPGATWHSFRHAHASLLLSEGISPALVAERLGHDITTLLTTYADVIRADDDRVRAVLDAHAAKRTEDLLRTEEA